MTTRREVSHNGDPEISHYIFFLIDAMLIDDIDGVFILLIIYIIYVIIYIYAYGLKIQ